MGKRSSRGGPPGLNPRKRQKTVHEAPTSEEIHSSRHLRQLLTFDQDLSKARHGLQSFKVLLDELNSSTTKDTGKLEVLTQYLLSSVSRVNGDDAGDDSEQVYLPDVMETWSFAAQVNSDELLSAVPVVLALLLKVLTHEPDLWPQALGLCRTLLQTPRLELLARNLSAERGKAFVISPTLRLVREAACFDGGALARAFFRARKHTLHFLSRNMRLKHLGEGVEDPKRASPRTNAVRLFLGLLSFLHWEAKRELLFERDIIPALMSSIKEDPPYLVLEILDCLKSHVLMDKKLPRDAKGKLLNSTTLARFSQLYSTPSRPSSGDDDQASRQVEDAIHDFLMAACTSPDRGVLRRELGFYPQGTSPSSDSGPIVTSHALQGTSSDVSLDRIVWMDKFKEEVPVHNAALSELLQNLRPWTSTKQSELIIEIFRAAPELVAPYFLSPKAFTFEPKLSATWIGYAALLFSTVQLPLPQFFGNDARWAAVPPPVSVVLENILPAPLNQRALARCLSHDSKLVTFFAIRLLVIALQKLETALDMMREAARVSGPLWSDAARRLTDEFCQRCPGMMLVVAAFRGIPAEDFLSREAASRLLRLCYLVIPQHALLGKWDVSPFLVNAIKRLDNQDFGQSSQQDRCIMLIELENLLDVARASHGMRWFSKAEELSLSPFTALLKLYANAPEGLALEPLEEVLDFVATEQEIFLPSSEGFTLNLFNQCLRILHGDQVNVDLEPEFWAFLDNCLHRCSTTPARYLAIAEEEYQSSATAMGPLLMAMVEQLPFLQSAGRPEFVAVARKFVSVYVAAASKVGNEAEAIFSAILDKAGATPFVSDKIRLIVSTKKTTPALVDSRPPQTSQLAAATVLAPEAPKTPEEALGDLATYSKLPELDNSALLKWNSKSVDDLVEEGFAGSLIMLLSSPHISIRKEALTNILKMAAKIKESSYEEKDQIWLLLSELAESARTGGAMNREPVPGHIVAFSRNALDVLKTPLHCLYDKVNSFLTRGPVWSLDKLPLVHDILLEEPSRDDSYYSSLSWLLGYLLDSLRTPADVALFHDRRVYERIFSLASNGYMRSPLRMMLLRIIYRTTCIEGGSNTLVTRFGAISWLEMQAAQQLCHPATSSMLVSSSSQSHSEWELLKALQRRIWETCDQKRIEEWSRNGVGMVFSDSGQEM